MSQFIISTADDDLDAKKFISDRLDVFNQASVGKILHKEISILGRDHEGTVVGGVVGRVWERTVFVALLWIAETHRGEGHGTELLTAMEREAARFGAEQSYLDTFSFQARGFYEKRGYRVFGAIPNFFVGHDRYWMIKQLQASIGD
jgi:GNAT superfamily N-acetyltransferase